MSSLGNGWVQCRRACELNCLCFLQFHPDPVELTDDLFLFLSTTHFQNLNSIDLLDIQQCYLTVASLPVSTCWLFSMWFPTDNSMKFPLSSTNGNNTCSCCTKTHNSIIWVTLNGSFNNLLTQSYQFIDSTSCNMYL
jgi:hypothetical protein